MSTNYLVNTDSGKLIARGADVKQLEEIAAGEKYNFEIIGDDEKPDRFSLPLLTKIYNANSEKQIKKLESKKAGFERVLSALAAVVISDSPKKTKAKAGGKDKAPSGGKRAIALERKIKVLAETNPRREGSPTHKRFALYKTGMTVVKFIELGGELGDVRWDLAHGHIALEG